MATRRSAEEVQSMLDEFRQSGETRPLYIEPGPVILNRSYAGPFDQSSRSRRHRNLSAFEARAGNHGPPARADGSRQIFHGRVVRHWSAWDPARQFIWTHYLLTLEETLKGGHASNITVSEPGGSAGGTVMQVAGVPEYEDGEEVIVFLRRTPIGYWRCSGWAQGKYTVTRSPDGLKRIRTNLAGLTLVDRQPNPKSLRHLNGATVEEVKRLVRTEVKR